MSYVTEDSLKRYAEKEKEWCDKRFLSENDLNWQKTEKAGAVAYYPVGELPLEGTVEFKFKETLPAEGTKGPDNPSTITGVSQAKVKRCGKNLLPYPYQYESQTINDVVFTVNSDGTILVNGTNTRDSSIVFRLSQGVNNNPVLLKKDVTYFLSGCPSGGSGTTYKIYLAAITVDAFSNAADIGNGASVTPGKDTFISLYIQINPGVAVSNLVFKPQIALGSSGSEFEKGTLADYTISLGGTYYGGSINLATGEMTVTLYGHVFNGEESFNKFVSGNNSYYTFATPYPAKTTTSCTCTHFLAGGASGNLYTKTNEGRIVFVNNDIDSIENLKVWFSEENTNNTPVTVVYELATPYTVQLIPTEILSFPLLDKCTPRVNTLYTDADNIQVGYAKHPNRTAYELQQAITAIGG